MTVVENYNFPDDLYYHAEEHLWLRQGDEGVTVGVDALAQDALGTIVHLAIHQPGQTVSRGDQIGSLEAEKMVSPLIAPVSGTLVSVNDAAMETPQLVSDHPYGAGWLVVIEPTAFSEDASSLIHGDSLEEWAQAEVRRYSDQGWVG
jgi:glycine cleavage system H protein